MEGREEGRVASAMTSLAAKPVQYSYDYKKEMAVADIRFPVSDQLIYFALCFACTIFFCQPCVSINKVVSVDEREKERPPKKEDEEEKPLFFSLSLP